MPRHYTANEVVDILLTLGECRHNYRQASILYAQRYPERSYPTHSVIRNVERLARTRPIKFERRRHQLNENDPRVITVLATILLNPHDSTRNIQLQTGIPKSTVHVILKKYKLHPYHITLTHELQIDDCRNRLEFCLWADARIREDPDYFKYVMFSDESTFQNTGELNRHNCHFWGENNPHWYRQVDHQHRWKVTVWCGLLNGYLVGPYFFEGNVDQLNYLNLLENELPLMLNDVDLQTRLRMILQQDGAPPHYSRLVREFLDRNYPDRWIGRGSGFRVWPARSPDLTSPDFYLWGFLKNMVYQQAPTTRENLIERIRNACINIPRNVLISTTHDFRERIRLCIQQRGGHFEHIKT